MRFGSVRGGQKKSRIPIPMTGTTSPQAVSSPPKTTALKAIITTRKTFSVPRSPGAVRRTAFGGKRAGGSACGRVGVWSWSPIVVVPCVRRSMRSAFGVQGRGVGGSAYGRLVFTPNRCRSLRSAFRVPIVTRYRTRYCYSCLYRSTVSKLNIPIVFSVCWWENNRTRRTTTRTTLRRREFPDRPRSSRRSRSSVQHSALTGATTI
jgi:hypothetical protein